jgi:hypothetical protein
VLIAARLDLILNLDGSSRVRMTSQAGRDDTAGIRARSRLLFSMVIVRALTSIRVSERHRSEGLQRRGGLQPSVIQA